MYDFCYWPCADYIDGWSGTRPTILGFVISLNGKILLTQQFSRRGLS